MGLGSLPPLWSRFFRVRHDWPLRTLERWGLRVAAPPRAEGLSPSPPGRLRGLWWRCWFLLGLLSIRTLFFSPSPLSTLAAGTQSEDEETDYDMNDSD